MSYLWHLVGVVAFFLIFLTLGYWVFVFMTSNGTAMERLSSVFRGSLTILWARIIALTGMIATAMLNLSTDSGLQSTIQTVLEPKYFLLFLVAQAVVTELARYRTLEKRE